MAGLGFCEKIPNVLQYSSFPAVHNVVLSEVINFLLIVKPTTVLSRTIGREPWPAVSQRRIYCHAYKPHLTLGRATVTVELLRPFIIA